MNRLIDNHQAINGPGIYLSGIPMPRGKFPLSLSFELPTIVWLLKSALLLRANMRESPNVIITGTPGVGKTVHCEQLAQETGLRHLSVNKVAKDRGCFETYDQELETWVVDEDKVRRPFYVLYTSN